MLNNKLHIMCGWCGKHSELVDWNAITYEKCTNREMKRAYTQLSNERAFDKKSDTFYMCPKCEKWSRGCQLKIVDTDDERLKRLGNVPVVTSGKLD